MRGRRALVTGAAGSIGSGIIDLLTKESWLVLGTDMRPPKDKESEYFHFKVADLRDKDSVKQLFKEKIDVIFHCADILDYLVPTREITEANAEAMRNLCTFALRYSVKRIILLSSASVYGRNGFCRKIIDETAQVKPTGEMEESWLRMEKISLRFSVHFGLSVTILRYADVYGEGIRSGVGNLLSDLSKLYVLPVLKGYQIPFSLIQIRDLSRAALFLSKDQAANGEIYNVAEDNSLTLSELLDYSADLMKMKKVPLFLPQPWLVNSIALFNSLSDFVVRKANIEPFLDPKIVRYICHTGYYSNKKIKERGFRFLYADPRQGIADTIEWYGKQGWLSRETNRHKQSVAFTF